MPTPPAANYPPSFSHPLVLRCDVDDGPEDDRPGDHLMESDVLIEGDNVVERRAPEDGDEVPADGEEDEDHVDMQDQGSRTGNNYRNGFR